ncbi:dual oxidase maturation factor 1-like [Numida meleagris]|uniref:dual oxidase maturation factor 1-like n=1 Tax=Numida meleagris TaxID=8996 RepID=UPI000B3DB1C2|nr:dual oxidase maturation factor 1-like [Numida meleagris]
MTLWDGSFPFYPGTNACFPFDTTWAIIVSVFLSALATSIIILPGIRGKGRLFWLLRVVTGLFIGAVVLTIQFTRDWESGWVTANTSYKSFSRAVVNADIGLHIGLAGVNITLVGNPVNQVNETINYSEQFSWSFDADYDHSYSEGLEKGLPSPILYVAEKFTTQSPCNVHRQYRISSRYASVTLWMALCTWIVSILLFSMPVLLYGGYMLLLTAVLMLFSLLFFVTVRNIPKCPMQFGPASLKTDYGGSFWLTLTTGLLCLLLGLGVIVLNSVHPQKLKLVFNMEEGKQEEVDGWDKSHLPAETSSCEQDMLMVSLGELCEVTATKL